MERIEALRRVPFLKALPEATIAAVAAAGKERSLQKGEELFAENTACIGLVVVLEGAIKVYKLDSRGRELTLSVEEPGASVAELPLFDGGNYPAQSEAVKDNTTVLIVARNRFEELMELHPEITAHALRALAVRMRRQVQIIEAQTQHTVRARLAFYLLYVANGRPTFVLDETNEAIAGRIGSVRDVVSRTLGGLRDAGALRITGRSVTILDAEALRVVATSDERPSSSS